MYFHKYHFYRQKEMENTIIVLKITCMILDPCNFGRLYIFMEFFCVIQDIERREY